MLSIKNIDDFIPVFSEGRKIENSSQLFFFSMHLTLFLWAFGEVSRELNGSFKETMSVFQPATRFCATKFGITSFGVCLATEITSIRHSI